MMNSPSKVPDFQTILDASERIDGMIVRTPLVTNPIINEITGAKVFFKPECLQTTGSFKLRGASNAIAQLNETEASRGVVACSSGNHAQGVAEAARRRGIAATIVMPKDAPGVKLNRTRRSGAKVVTYNRETEDRDAIAKTLCDETGATFIHPFDNSNVLAGQGTSGLEIAKDLQALGEKPDHVLVCCGGGGLTSGLAVGLHGVFPEAKVHPVEPVGFDDYTRSLAAGVRLSNDHLGGSICDAILTPSPGEISFTIAQTHLSPGIVVDEDMVREAVRFAYFELKLVVEPGGAVALAALLASEKQYAGKCVVAVLSGGNADPALFSEIVCE